MPGQPHCKDMFSTLPPQHWEHVVSAGLLILSPTHWHCSTGSWGAWERAGAREEQNRLSGPSVSANPPRYLAISDQHQYNISQETEEGNFVHFFPS